MRTLTVLDISPTLKMYQSTNRAFAKAYYHWFFLIQEAPLPERLLAGQRAVLHPGPARARPVQAQALRQARGGRVRARFKDPRTIHATCEDYRAAATIDLVHDRKERKKLRMPVLALWGRHRRDRARCSTASPTGAKWRATCAAARSTAATSSRRKSPASCLLELRRFLKQNP